jgi:hypothetical protein
MTAPDHKDDSPKGLSPVAIGAWLGAGALVWLIVDFLSKVTR